MKFSIGLLIFIIGSVLFFNIKINVYATNIPCFDIRECDRRLPPGTHYCAPPVAPNICYDPTIPGEEFGCCMPILTPDNPQYRPGFYLPRTADIEELNNFRFHFEMSRYSIGRVISAALPWVFGISGLLLFFYLLYGAFQIVTAMGNAQKISNGRNIMVHALLGYAILACAYWIGLIASTVLGINFGIR